MTDRSGSVKVPGGKLVRVTLAAGARLDGDFFADGDARDIIASVERIVADAARDLDTILAADSDESTESTESTASVESTDSVDPDAPTVRAVEGWYRETVRWIDDVLGGRLIGANADAIALATLRAMAGDSVVARAFEARHMAQVRRSWQAAQHPYTSTPMRIGADEIEARWASLRPRVVVDRPRMPEEQMALEPQWARQVAAGLRAPTIRIWDWAAPAVVCGRYQSIEDEVDVAAARARGVHIVRRGTGGGTMFIEPADTITYSLYAPLWFVDGLDAVQTYQLCDAWLLKALVECGVHARYAGLNDIAADPADPARIGGKIGGAAQMRVPARDGGPGCLLHHVTLAYAIDASAMADVLITDPEKMSDKAVKSARRRVEPMTAQTTMTRAQIVATMARVAADFGTRTR